MLSEESSEPSQQVNIDVGSVTASDSATVNIAGGHIIQAAAGATVIIGAQAGAGLQALSDLVKLSPEVRAAVGTFSADFKAAIAQVDVLGDYKDLHDLLHQIQFNCYTPLMREANYFPDDRTLESFPQYERDLRNILSQLTDVSGRQRVACLHCRRHRRADLGHDGAGRARPQRPTAGTGAADDTGLRGGQSGRADPRCMATAFSFGLCGGHGHCRARVDGRVWPVRCDLHAHPAAPAGRRQAGLRRRLGSRSELRPQTNTAPAIWAATPTPIAIAP